MTDQTTPLERLNALESLVVKLQNEKYGVLSEDLYPKRLHDLPVWRGGEHLLLRCYKRTPIVLSEYMLPVEMQSDSKGQVEINIVNQQTLYTAIILDCGNAVLLVDWQMAQKKRIKTSSFSDLFDLNGYNADEIKPSTITSLPYFCPIEYGRRWILNMSGRLDNGLIAEPMKEQERNRGQLQEEIVRKLALDQRELAFELRTLKADISELTRQINDLSHLIKANTA